MPAGVGYSMLPGFNAPPSTAFPIRPPLPLGMAPSLNPTRSEISPEEAKGVILGLGLVQASQMEAHAQKEKEKLAKMGVQPPASMLLQGNRGPADSLLQLIRAQQVQGGGGLPPVNSIPPIPFRSPIGVGPFPGGLPPNPLGMPPTPVPQPPMSPFGPLALPAAAGIGAATPPAGGSRASVDLLKTIMQSARGLV